MLGVGSGLGEGGSSEGGHCEVRFCVSVSVSVSGVSEDTFRVR